MDFFLGVQLHFTIDLAKILACFWLIAISDCSTHITTVFGNYGDNYILGFFYLLLTKTGL